MTLPNINEKLFTFWEYILYLYKNNTMEKQTEVIIIKIDKELKNKFTTHAGNKQMKISTRIKYLMKMDIDGKININNG